MGDSLVKRNMHDGGPGRTMRMGAYSLRDARLVKRRSRQGDLTAVVGEAIAQRPCRVGTKLDICLRLAFADRAKSSGIKRQFQP